MGFDSGDTLLNVLVDQGRVDPFSKSLASSSVKQIPEKEADILDTLVTQGRVNLTPKTKKLSKPGAFHADGSSATPFDKDGYLGGVASPDRPPAANAVSNASPSTSLPASRPTTTTITSDIPVAVAVEPIPGNLQVARPMTPRKPKKTLFGFIRRKDKSLNI